jgi:hypothetical protein
LIVIEQIRFRIDAIRERVKHLGRCVLAITVGQVSAGAEIHAEQALIAEPLAQLFPLFFGEVGGIFRAQFGDPGDLDARVEDGPERHQVGIRAAVRLHVGMLGSEEFLRAIHRVLFDGIDVVAARVEAMMCVAFRVLVGKEIGHCALRGERGVVLASDQLDVAALVDQFLQNGGGDGRGHGGNVFEIRQKSEHPGIDLMDAPSMLLKVCSDQRIRH